jgi:glycosyltransferase involved in cell wall biosynthesis
MRKNIAFSWVQPFRKNNGGIERVTTRLMAELNETGYNCIPIELNSATGKVITNNCQNVDLEQFLMVNGVETLVDQNGTSDQISRILMHSEWRGKLIVCHHIEPLYLRKIFNFRRAVRESLSPKMRFLLRLQWIARTLSYPLWNVTATQKIRQVQQNNCRRAEYYVLLSNKFAKDFLNLIGNKKKAKIVAIPNPLSFDIEPEAALKLKKRKEVLIVSRLDDPQKRIIVALKIWKIVQNKAEGWTLKIVGNGPDEAMIQRTAKRLGLRRVRFYEAQDPQPHYETASLFMMTSRVEGWGQTLTEAMQHCVVPVAFDSYASLTDIIENRVTGLVIPDMCIRQYASELLKLMVDNEKLRSIAIKSVFAVQKFNVKNIIEEWNKIL